MRDGTEDGGLGLRGVIGLGSVERLEMEKRAVKEGKAVTGKGCLVWRKADTGWGRKRGEAGEGSCVDEAMGFE